LPRNVRTKLKAFEEKYNELTSKLGRKPVLDEIVDYVQMPVEKVANFLNLIETGQLASLDSFIDDDNDLTLIDTIKSYVSSPEEMVSKEQIIEKLGMLIDELSEKERLVITLYYYEELTMKEIGEVLRISESRVSQIHSETVKKLRKRLKGVS